MTVRYYLCESQERRTLTLVKRRRRRRDFYPSMISIGQPGFWYCTPTLLQTYVEPTLVTIFTILTFAIWPGDLIPLES